MGSVIDYIECPKCGGEAYDEFYYKSGEEFLVCPHCGYNRKFFITNWDDKEKEGEEWMPKFDLEEFGGIGAYRLRQKGAVGHELGSFTDERGVEEFIKLVEDNKEKIEHAEYTHLVDGKMVTTILIHGDVEKAYEEERENEGTEIEIISMTDAGVSNTNRTESTKSHKDIEAYLSSPDEWTDDVSFKDKQGVVYFINDLVGKNVKLGGKTILVKESHYAFLGVVDDNKQIWSN